jgi:hypothetical protein
MVVDFPAPLGPKKPWIVPFLTENEISFKTSAPAKLL